MGYAYPDADPPEAPEACELYFNADGNRQAIPGTLLMDGGVRQSICANVAEAPSATPGGCHPHWSSTPTTSARCSAITLGAAHCRHVRAPQAGTHRRTV